jgi:hypothetical protein
MNGTDDDKKEPNTRVAFVLSNEDAEKLERIAAAERSTISQVVRKIVGDALDDRYANA